ncbi:adhesion G-protein coupled receptor G6-like [Octopus sinensis]|uniref:Adhesion G-protein coupled receptor G6-like n=1 Tax=Octopus sinensis TaxID=2607531 RepID=A0A6P7TR07_9MOLL|nr:adhesion G-protein coupled receptor G6-like [Octopus sinensis]
MILVRKYKILANNEIAIIEHGSFEGLINLKKLNLANNKIAIIEHGSFDGLTNVEKFDLRNNTDMMCGCQLPAMSNYIKSTYKRTVTILGKCHTNLGSKDKLISIMEYSQCKGKTLFQKNLQCQTCSGMTCDYLEMRSCPGLLPLCQYGLSVDGSTLKFQRSCSTYNNCLEAFRNNSLTCKNWSNGTACVACCRDNLCNKNDFPGWTHSFELHLIYTVDAYSTFKKLTENEKTTENVSRAVEHELLTLTGVFKVEYCSSEKSSVVFTLYCTVLIGSTKDRVLQNIYKILNTSQTLRNSGMKQVKVNSKSEMFCNEDTSTNNGAFKWPMTKVGTNATIRCHANVATRHCSSRTSPYMTSRKCSPFTGVWQEPDMSQCNNTEWITRELKNITIKGIDEENFELVSTNFLNISEKSVYFKKEDVDLVVEVLEKMVPLTWNVSVNITLNNVLPSINNMINTPEKILGGEPSKRIVNRMLDIIETIPEQIPLGEQSVTALYSNLGIGAAKVEKDTFNGLTYAVSYGTNETEVRTDIHQDSDLQVDDTMDFISLPKSLLKHMNCEELLNLSRISMVCLLDDKLYRVQHKSNTKANTKINSHIFAVNIPNVHEPVTNLDEPIRISLHVTDPNAINPQCVYWDESSEHWSTKGCNMSRYVPGKKVFCSCNHLTSFAILMDVYQNVKNSQLLSILSNIGSGISFVCLILTVIIHVYSKTLWKVMASKILVNLCISLAATYLTFLAGFKAYSTEITAVCKAVAALLHYFLLTSFIWMAVEALHIFLGVVVVFNTYQPSFIKKCSILVWGIPVVIVIITLAINNTNNYIKSEQACWLSSTAFYAALLAPVALILLFNITMFSLVMRSLNSMQNDKKFEHKPKKVRVFGIVGLCFLLGFPWLLPFFGFGEAAEVFHLLFTIFTPLQGMFIFLCYCIYKKDTRDVICLFVCKRKTWELWEDPKNIKVSPSTSNEKGDKTAETDL